MSNYTLSDKLVAEYQDDFVRIIHDQSPSTFDERYPLMDFLYIYTKESPQSFFTLSKTMISDKFIGKNKMAFKI